MVHNLSKKIMKNAVIVGGGLAGIVAAKVLASSGYSIKIIEAGSKIGGLIRSKKIKNFYFDHGPHKIQETYNKKLNKFFFNKIEKYFYSYNSLPQNHFINNKWYDSSSFADLRTFEKNIFNKIYQEILLKKKNKSKIKKNEKKQCYYNYGKTLTNHLISPLMKKYTGSSLENLETNKRNLFNLSRFLIADKHTTQKLKKNKFLNNIIGYNSYKEGLSGRRNFYPKRGGIEELISFLLKNNSKNKIKFYLKKNIIKMNLKKNKISELILNNGETVSADLFVWTGNIKFLNNLLFIKNLNKLKKKIFWNFSHFISSKKLDNKVFYSYNYDKKNPIYRITYYDNFQKIKKTKNYRNTVEVVLPQKKNKNFFKNITLNLKKMGLIKKNTKIKLLDQYSIPYNISQEKDKISKKIKKLKNLLIFGQAANKFSKEEIIKDIYEKLK